MKILPSNQLSLEGIRDKGLQPTAEAAGNPQEVLESFQTLLEKSVNSVNELQQVADELGARAALGELDDPATAIIAMEKAQLALDMTTQVRNKLVNAYREIMRMPI